MGRAMKYLKITISSVALASGCVLLGGPALAQDEAPDYLDRLAQCRQIAEPEERLACYDREVGAVVAAGEQGEVRIVDSEDVRQTRRKLFGFSIPKNLFGSDDGDDQLDELETTITRVQRSGRSDYLITTEEGSVWRIANPPMRFAPPKAGQRVVFKTAALGSFFIRVNGQIGVKGVRVQ